MTKKTIFIEVGDRKYPFRMTLGAMLRFKRATGKEVTELNEESVEEMASFLYACLASACAADKVPFSYTFDEFCDLLSVEDMEAMRDLLTGEEAHAPEEGPGEEKKS